jgi:hypothetical protein
LNDFLMLARRTTRFQKCVNVEEEKNNYHSMVE